MLSTTPRVNIPGRFPNVTTGDLHLHHISKTCTTSISLISRSCHDANFVATAWWYRGCRSPTTTDDRVGITTTCGRQRHALFLWTQFSHVTCTLQCISWQSKLQEGSEGRHLGNQSPVTCMFSVAVRYGASAPRDQADVNQRAFIHVCGLITPSLSSWLSLLFFMPAASVGTTWQSLVRFTASTSGLDDLTSASQRERPLPRSTSNPKSGRLDSAKSYLYWRCYNM